MSLEWNVLLYCSRQYMTACYFEYGLLERQEVWTQSPLTLMVYDRPPSWVKSREGLLLVRDNSTWISQRKSSLDFEDNFRFRWKLILNTTSSMAVKTINSPSQHYNQPEDQTPSRLCPSSLQTICKTVCRHRRCADGLVPLWKNLHSLTKCLTSTKKQASQWRLSWQLKEKKKSCRHFSWRSFDFFNLGFSKSPELPRPCL